MKNYIATVKVNGTTLKTMLFAESSIHARLILEYKFGIDSVIHAPTFADGATNGCLTLDEVSSTIKPIKPLSPQQARLERLKQQKEIATKNLKSERDRLKIVKAQQQIQSIIS